MIKKKLKTLLFIFAGIICFWVLLTIWVQYAGKQQGFNFGDQGASRRALIVYNPDPIYNLDEQVCKSFATGLGKYGFLAKVATTGNAENEKGNFELYVFCANTYNWAPDWGITKFIKNTGLDGVNTVAITLGSGSTQLAKEKLEKLIIGRRANLLDSKSYWLLRPNDEKRQEEKNVDVAIEMARAFGERIGRKLTKADSIK